MAIRFKAILPDYYDEDAFSEAVEAIFDKTESDFATRFGTSYETWDHQPKFVSSRRESGRSARLTYGTNDKIYGFVNNGTVPHFIKPKKKKALKFKKGYRAKTVRGPGRLQSRAGGSFGDDVLTRKTIEHPGTDARRFDLEVVRQVEPRFHRYVNEEFTEALKQRRRRP